MIITTITNITIPNIKQLEDAQSKRIHFHPHEAFSAQLKSRRNTDYSAIISTCCCFCSRIPCQYGSNTWNWSARLPVGPAAQLNSSVPALSEGDPHWVMVLASAQPGPSRRRHVAAEPGSGDPCLYRCTFQIIIFCIF